MSGNREGACAKRTLVHRNTSALVQAVEIWSGHFLLLAILFLVSIRFNFLNKILVIRSLKTVYNFCYLTIYARFRHFFGFMEIARFWWVLAKKCKRLFLLLLNLLLK